MKTTTRKLARPAALVATLAVIGILAAFVALAWSASATQAQIPEPGTPGATATPTPTGTMMAPEGAPPPPPLPTNRVAVPNGIVSSSTTGDAAVELKLTVSNPGMLVAGSSIELYLEDDYQVPSSMPARSVYVVGSQGVGRVYVTAAVEIDDDDHFGGDDDWAIQAFIPDMNPDNDTGFDNWSADAAAGMQLVFTKEAGIKNPTEAGSHSIGFSVLGADDDNNDGPMTRLTDLKTVAKISLSAEDGARGKKVTVTGTGFNNDVGAEVRVRHSTAANPIMKPTNAMEHMALCASIMRPGPMQGDLLGKALVGKNDKFSIEFTVHQDEFKPGAINYICAADSEAGNPRAASAVKVFELTASITLDPASGSYGDEITLKARDFGGTLDKICLGATSCWTAAAGDTDGFTVMRDDHDYKFELPGGLAEAIQVSAHRGSTRKTGSLMVEPSSLSLSKAKVAPNESIIIRGRGFEDEAYIYLNKITIDGKQLAVEEAAAENSPQGRRIRVDSNGNFVVETRVWIKGADSNPALDADTYKIKIVDSNNFEAEADIEILEPTLKVTPEVAGPRDTIAISGTNWPLSTEDRDYQVTITVDGRTRTESIDAAGRFHHEVRLTSDIALGEEHEITVRFRQGDDEIEEDVNFMTPSSGVTITPAKASPGQTITAELIGMPVFTLVSEVRIAGANRIGNVVVNTDRDGNGTVDGILVPAVDAGHYSVQVKVGNETAVAQLEIIDEGLEGVVAMLPDAITAAGENPIGDNLDAIFHFNNATKMWSFYDPRPEFKDLNTLTELTAGQPYWVLVKKEQVGADWNGRLQDFTCAGSDCWNLAIW